MDAAYERCCGLDVHERTVAACLLTPGPGGAPRKALRTSGAMTDDLLGLADWLATAGCTRVAMEGTGSYRKPIWNLLEGGFDLLLVNARHIKAVPGRKADMKDAEWIATLPRPGLLKPGSVPDRPRRELRELARYRTSLVRERAAEINRLQRTLGGANIKPASVATEIPGASGRQMLEAPVAGASDAAALAELAPGRPREKLPRPTRAPAGRSGAHQRSMLAEQLAHVDYLDEAIERVSAEIRARLRPFEAAVERPDAIPGVGRRAAEVLVAEIGTDMPRSPTAAHLASRAGPGPGQHERAGKRSSGKTRQGNRWLRAAPVEAAPAASRTRNSYLAARYRRLAARRGRQRAAVAVGHPIPAIAHALLNRPDPHQDPGGRYSDERDRHAVERRRARRLEALGSTVILEPDPA
jgi:transposase